MVVYSVRNQQNFQAPALGNFHDRVSSVAWAWGQEISSETMHVYMSNIGLRTLSHSCHLVVANVTSDQLFQYIAAPLPILQFPSICNDHVPLFGGGLPLDVLSILQAIHCDGSLRVAFSFIRLHVCKIGTELCFCQCVIEIEELCKDQVWWIVSELGKMNTCCFFMIWPLFGGRACWRSSFDSWAGALTKLAVMNEFSSFALDCHITTCLQWDPHERSWCALNKTQHFSLWQLHLKISSIARRMSAILFRPQCPKYFIWFPDGREVLHHKLDSFSHHYAVIHQ